MQQIIDNLIARVTALEQLCRTFTASGDNINLNGIVIRYVVLSQDNKRILTNVGFKNTDAIKDSTFKLFTSTSNAREYIKNHSLYRKLKTKIVRVRIAYEMLNEVVARGGDTDE